jgi:hypothetical protein
LVLSPTAYNTGRTAQPRPGGTPTVKAQDVEKFSAVGRRALKRLDKKGSLHIVGQTLDEQKAGLLAHAPLTTNVSRSRAMAAAITAASRVRAGGSY